MVQVIIPGAGDHNAVIADSKQQPSLMTLDGDYISDDYISDDHISDDYISDISAAALTDAVPTDAIARAGGPADPARAGWKASRGLQRLTDSK